MSDLDGNVAHVIVTCDDKGTALTLTRLIEEALRAAGFPEVRHLSPADARNRALGLFPVENARIRTMGQETFVSIGAVAK